MQEQSKRYGELEMIKAGIHDGEVVWYNDRRGYGFVSIGKDEIFIHRTVLERFGLSFLHSGDKLKIDVATNDDGPAITEIRGIEREAPASLPSDTEPQENELRGIVKFFNPLKGYGFIEIEGGDKTKSDVFIHSRTLQACGLRTITEGQSLLLFVSDDGKGPQATEVRIIASH